MLKLQKIELLGFKSFADRTEISFNGGGVAAIVGPNGCGKSNISDAISWVLGEQSARNLRSGRMQDVIFNGTRGRRATGLAEVRLTLLDREMAAGLPFDAEEAAPGNGRVGGPRATGRPGEIVVSRRLFHSGESEYLLNGRPCRLRDIQEVFLGTGLGPDSYAIIEQGRIGQILSSKPYERRALIEEAAGVTKFKAKRKLAWTKLESSRQNLARVNDILEEITRQLNSLKRQAARARRYGELRDQMRGQLRLLLATRYREREQEAVGIALELGQLNRSLEERGSQIQSRETEQRELQHLHESAEAELRRAVEERATLRLGAERARSQVAAQSQQIAYLETRMEEAQAEQTGLRSRLENLRLERNGYSGSLTEIQAEVETLAAQWKECESRSQVCQDELKQKETKLERLRQELLESVDQCATLRNQAVQLEQFRHDIERQAERTESERCSAEAERQAAACRRAEADAEMNRQQAELEAVVAQRRSLEDHLHLGKEEESRQRAQLEEWRADLSAQRARLSSLEEILARRAYSTETVKRLFERHGSRRSGSQAVSQSLGSGGGEKNYPAFEPVGVLADFIEVETAYEPMVEEFLREELDYIVVKEWASLSEGVRLLRTEVPGRATFLLHPADSAPSNGNGSVVAEGCDSLPGVLGLLESRLRFTNGFSQDAGALLPKLRRCYLVSDAEAGRALAGKYPELYFLTPEGDWFQGGLVTAGKADASGPLALKRELRELTRTVADQEEAVARTAENLARTAENIEQQQVALRLLTERQQDAEKRLVGAERDLKEAAESLERAVERLSVMTLEVERLGREAERARQQHARDAEEIALREQRRVEIETETGALSRTMTELEAEREASNTRAMEIQSRRAALEERRRACADALARVESGIEELSRRGTELERQGEQWSRQRADYLENNQCLEQEAAAAEQRSEQLALRLAELEEACRRHRARAAELEQELQQHRRQLEEARSQKTAVEVRLARLESELGHLKESCRNELQMEMEALTAEDLPFLNAAELADAEENYRQLKSKIEALGPINMMALEEFEECRQRHDFLDLQRQDLLDSIRDTTQAIQEIDEVSRRQFEEAFERINGHFQHTFELLFGGGQGMLRLTEADNPAEAGVEIVAQPPGKRLQNVLLLSGGEKALAALALLLAIFRYQPSPFCVLDEVDAPLDEANISRFTAMVEEMSRETQFIIITHSKKTMGIAPVLYGVTMEEVGVSKIVSVQLNGTASEPVLAPSRSLAEVGA